MSWPSRFTPDINGDGAICPAGLSRCCTLIVTLSSSARSDERVRTVGIFLFSTRTILTFQRGFSALIRPLCRFLIHQQGRKMSFRFGWPRWTNRVPRNQVEGFPLPRGIPSLPKLSPNQISPHLRPRLSFQCHSTTTRFPKLFATRGSCIRVAWMEYLYSTSCLGPRS